MRNFLTDKNIIIVDEIGDVGEDTPDDPTFTYSATITKKPSLFGYIAIKFRTKFRDRLVDGELKASALYPNQREEILTDISELDPEIHAIQIDKNAKDNPKWWSQKIDRKWIFRETLAELMDETFSETEDDDFIIIVDHNDHIKNETGKTIVKRASERNKKNVIDCKVKDSKNKEYDSAIRGHGHQPESELSRNKEYSDLIQANDVIPREVRDREKGKKDGQKLNIKTKRLTINNVRKTTVGENKQEFMIKGKQGKKQTKFK